MSHDYPHLRSLVFDRPLAIHPGKLQDILHVMGPRFDLKNIPVGAQSGEPRSAFEEMPESARLMVIPVHGTLVNRGGGLDAMSGLMAYDVIRAMLQIGLADPRYDAIVLDIDSFGGEAAGMADLAADIREVDAEKPVYAVVNAHALSAGYGIASAARRIFAMQDALVGSVGVIAAHRDQSKHDEQEGFEWTIFKAGERKDDFSPLKPLNDEAVAWIEARIEESYSKFVALVAQHRGLSEQAVRDTQAAMYSAADALEVGLVDAIMPADTAVETINSEVMSMSREDDGRTTRADQPGNGGPAADGGKPTNPERTAETEQPETTTDAGSGSPDKGTEVSADVQAQIDKAVAQARADERQAVQANAKAIREACETMHRPELAAQFIEQGLSVEDARAKLFETASADADQTAVDTNHDGAAPSTDEVEAQAQSILQHKTGA